MSSSTGNYRRNFNRMNNTRICGPVLVSLFSLVFTGAALLAAQTKPSSSASQQVNLSKEILDHKDKIQWRPAANPGLPPEVCSLLQACSGDMPKFYTLPLATIDGRKVGRAVYLTTAKGKDALILEHQTRSDAYFFLLGPDGNIQKTVYLEQGKPFFLIANELAQPTFDKDKKDWHDWASKLGSAQ
jgi:hypothetical protein